MIADHRSIRAETFGTSLEAELSLRIRRLENARMPRSETRRHDRRDVEDQLALAAAHRMRQPLAGSA